jgi:hypothetical protein
MSVAGNPVLDAEQASFIQGGVSVVVAARDADNLPRVARAFGCRVAEDRSSVGVFLARCQAAPLLAAIRAQRTIAVVFTLPSSHRSLQLKGVDAAIMPPAEGDLERARRHVDAFVADIVPLGYAESVMRALLWLDPAELTVVTFTPEAAFEQTPGPRAGERIGS